MSKKRRFIWARFFFWVFIALSIAWDQVHDHPVWLHVVQFAAMVICWIAAGGAWKELEEGT